MGNSFPRKDSHLEMLKLRDITLGDKAWMQPIYKASAFCSEEYNFSFNYMWQKILSYRVQEMDGFLIQKSDNSRPCYLYPPGSGNVKPVIEAMIKDAKDNEHGFLFYTVLAEQCKLLEVLFPGMFDFWPQTDYDEYIYDAKSLITLTGKKYHSKRNHINRFKTSYPDWQYEPITHQNMPEVIAMSEEWCKQNTADGKKSLEQECRALYVALNDYFGLGMDGGLIRVGGRVIAFSMGDRLTEDIYLTHIEKAFTEYHGAYAMINQQFSEHNASGYTYINREDDSGDEGLRKAKLSYYPVMRTEKYAARLKGTNEWPT